MSDINRSYDVLGVSISTLSLAEVLIQLKSAINENRPLGLHLCNVYTLSLVANDENLRKALAAPALNLPDGAPIAYLGRRFGVKKPIRGADLFRELTINTQWEVRHFFYGGKKGIVDQLASRLQQENSSIQIGGFSTPPMTNLTDSELVLLNDRILASKSSVVWIGLGTPKQDYVVDWFMENSTLVVIPIGAVFDFYAGSVKEAPEWLRNSGFEWLHRLCQEPKRLWKRYTVHSALFLYEVIRWRLKK
jgi:N-acetylglucosaminyldiphosphoundecaprenol N-acetyl-beta-D-mannosaminyltransferase